MDGTLKIFDFGLSTVVPNSSPCLDDTYELSGETGSLRYMAPEVARKTPYNHKADVYSFGIILWELFTCQVPFAKMNRQEFFNKVVRGGQRPEISKKCPHDLVKIIRDCWDVDPQKRPTFQAIVLKLADMLSNEMSTVNKDHPKILDKDRKRVHGCSRGKKFAKQLAAAA